MTNDRYDELLQAVSPDRKASIIKLLAAGAFAVPMVSSFAMKRLTLNGWAVQGIGKSPKTIPPSG